MSSGMRTCLTFVKLREHIKRARKIRVACRQHQRYSQLASSNLQSAVLKGETDNDPEKYDLLSVYIEGLDKKFKEQDVKQLFPEATSFYLPNVKGQSKLLGHGVVTFPSELLANEAIQKMNGTVMGNKKQLTVSRALKPAEEWLTLDKIEIPKKIKRTPTSILEALSKTVGKDFTSYPYYYIDDPELYPHTERERLVFSLSKAGGRRAAQYIINTYRECFTKDQSVPSIEVFGPKPNPDKYEYNDKSEQALLERIQRRNVTDAIKMFDKIASRRGDKVSEETKLLLLDLLTVYNNKNPQNPEKDFLPEEYHHRRYLTKKEKQQRDTFDHAYTKQNLLTKSWDSEDGYAEKMFRKMLESDTPPPTRAYNALLKGRAKYADTDGTFKLYEEMIEKNIPVDLQASNLVLSMAFVVGNIEARVLTAKNVMRNIERQGIRPNHQTFHNYLQGLRFIKSWQSVKNNEAQATSVKNEAIAAINEMKAIGLEPCFGTWYQFLGIFELGPDISDIFHQVLQDLEGKALDFLSVDDELFFAKAMSICKYLQDIDSANKLDALLQTGANYNFLRSESLESIYTHKYFSLVKEFEPIDKIMEFLYTRFNTASTIYTDVFCNLIDNEVSLHQGFQYLPGLWTAAEEFKLSMNKVATSLLRLMGSKKQDSELQEQFVKLAKEMVKEYQEKLKRQQGVGRSHYEWTSESIFNLIRVFLYGEKFEDAWSILKIYNTSRTEYRGEIDAKAVDQLLDECIKRKSLEKSIVCIKMIGEDLSSDPGLIDKAKEKLLESEIELSDIDKDVVQSI